MQGCLLVTFCSSEGISWAATAWERLGTRSAMAAPSICRKRLVQLIESEERVYAQRHPKSLALYRESSECLLAGVPMHWM